MPFINFLASSMGGTSRAEGVWLACTCVCACVRACRHACVFFVCPCVRAWVCAQERVCVARRLTGWHPPLTNVRHIQGESETDDDTQVLPTVDLCSKGHKIRHHVPEHKTDEYGRCPRGDTCNLRLLEFQNNLDCWKKKTSPPLFPGAFKWGSGPPNHPLGPPPGGVGGPTFGVKFGDKKPAPKKRVKPHLWRGTTDSPPPPPADHMT